MCDSKDRQRSVGNNASRQLPERYAFFLDCFIIQITTVCRALWAWLGGSTQHDYPPLALGDRNQPDRPPFGLDVLFVFCKRFGISFI